MKVRSLFAIACCLGGFAFACDASQARPADAPAPTSSVVARAGETHDHLQRSAFASLMTKCGRQVESTVLGEPKTSCWSKQPPIYRLELWGAPTRLRRALLLIRAGREKTVEQMLVGNELFESVSGQALGALMPSLTAQWQAGRPATSARGGLSFSVEILNGVGYSAWTIEDPTVSAPPLEPREDWYHGGTLQRATVAEWRAATPENRGASAADWVLALPDVWEVIKRSSDRELALWQRAMQLSLCVDEVQMTLSSTAELASTVAMCAVLLFSD